MRLPRIEGERGLTLTEFTIVAALGGMVMIGLVGFYMSSQGTWMDASSLAITQREATTLIENMADKVHAAAGASSDTISHQLTLFDRSSNAIHAFWWEASGSNPDSLIHEGPNGSVDRGAVITSKCERFRCTAAAGMVEVDLVLRSAQGERYALTTKLVMMNR